MNPHTTHARADAEGGQARPGPVQLPRVALVVNRSDAHGRRVIDGVNAFLSRHEVARRWLLEVPSMRGNRLPAPGLSGVIGDFTDAEHFRRYAALSPVIVATGIDRGVHDVPGVAVDRVLHDEDSIGRRAAEEFLHRGFRRFGFYAQRPEVCEHEAWAARRRDGFARVVEQAGHACVRLPGDAAAAAALLAAGPLPAAVFALNDTSGRVLLGGLRGRAVRVPEEVAVIGCDNDRQACETCHPPLSSVETGSFRIGFAAAERLWQRLHAPPGDPPQPLHALVPCTRLETRHSGDVFAVDDRVIQRALQLIRERLGGDLRPEDLLAELPVRRRNLEERFRLLLGRGIMEEVRRQRIERAKELMVQTDRKIDVIARDVGFASRRAFHGAFVRLCGVTPRAFRDERTVAGRD